MSSSIQMEGGREGNGKFDRRDQRLMTVQDVEKKRSGDFARMLDPQAFKVTRVYQELVCHGVG
jgi:hypothetical protein